jgi:hypothetical protein
MRMIAEGLGDKRLEDLLEAGEASLRSLATSDPAAARLRAAEEELRRRFLAAVGERP